MRINKYLAYMGLASRRKADDLIKKGKVTINNTKAELGDEVNEGDIVEVNNKKVASETEKKVYYILNKPKKVLSAASDNRKRKTVTSIVKIPERVYPVGRLDFLSEGLVLLTNDGELTYKITHPKHHISKKYYVKTVNPITNSDLTRLSNGSIKIDNKTLKNAYVEKLGENEFEITLFEGKKRQIREMVKAINNEVERLIRLELGPLKLENLRVGDFRACTKSEIEDLKNLLQD